MKLIQLFLFIIFCSFTSHAQGDLLIFPKRLVFDQGKNVQELNLSNKGKDTARYVISVVQVRMNDNGGFEYITHPDEGQQFADKNFRFFPRQVVLAPGEIQTVKVQLVRSQELQAGEYRSHLYFRAEPEGKPLGRGEKEPSTALSVQIKTVFGISVPVILRKGEPELKIAISNYSLETVDSLPSLELQLNRSGNISAYGDLAVDHVTPLGKLTRVSQMKGLALYTPNTVRNFKINLPAHQGIDYNSGILRISFTDPSARNLKLAEEEIYLGGTARPVVLKTEE